MAQYDFQDEAPGAGFFSVTTQALQILVRLVGIGLLLVGLWVGVKVVMEAWNLYSNPDNGRVERVAAAIDRGSNLDKLLNAARPAPATGTAPSAGTDATERDAVAERLEPPAASTPAGDDDLANLRLSYFLAWIIVLLLLLIVGRLAMAAVRTGGELALYDAQVKKFARALIEQTRVRERP